MPEQIHYSPSIGHSFKQIESPIALNEFSRERLAIKQSIVILSNVAICLLGLIRTQGAFPEQDRAGWSKLQADKDEVVRIFSRNAESWPELVQSAIENIDKDTINTWP